MMYQELPLLLFIRIPKEDEGQIPSLYLLPSRNTPCTSSIKSIKDQKVIKVPAPPPSDPKMYYVNYAEGQNPTFPSGVDLQTALDAASAGRGQSVGGPEDVTGGVGSAISSNDGFGGSIGLGSRSAFGSSSNFESGSSFEGSIGLGSKIGRVDSDGFVESNSIGSNSGFGVSNGYWFTQKEF